ncbi:MAG: hypothetical protein M3O23_11295 [Actinomycetota bacterium]|nr:hypothetical protein [Actinomycetota bacterium]
MQVLLLLVLIWAAVLVPPAVRAHSRRRAEFVDSFGPPLPGLDRSSAPGVGPAALRPRGVRMTRAQRRRHILRGLLIAMAVTLVGGLLPPLRVLLVVHLFLVDSFLAYITLLVHMRRAEDAASAAAREPVRDRARRSALDVVGRARMPDLPPLAGAWGD